MLLRLSSFLILLGTVFCLIDKDLEQLILSVHLVNGEQVKTVTKIRLRVVFCRKTRPMIRSVQADSCKWCCL